jgi:hypothetical protein
MHVNALPKDLFSNKQIWGLNDVSNLAIHAGTVDTQRARTETEPAGAGGNLESHSPLQPDLQTLLFDFH